MDTVKALPLEGIGAVLGAIGSILTAMNAGKITDWWRTRADRRANEAEARKTTRVLLETISLKNEELAMKDRIIAGLERSSERQDREQERMQAVITQQREYIARLQAGKDGSP